MKLPCENARSLLWSYLDGELSEAQASPLRAHLLDCPACRESAKEGRAQHRWFAAAREEPVVVPPGFAARVARRAFAGDPGLALPYDEEVAERGTLLPFVLTLSAVAAGVLLLFSLAIRRQSLPQGDGLDAQGPGPWHLQESEQEPSTPERAERPAKPATDPEEDQRGER